MPHSAFSKIYLHVTWHVKDDQPLLSSEKTKLCYSIIHEKSKGCRELLIIEIGGTENHLHLAAKVPPTLQIANWIGEIKGSTSFAIKRLTETKGFSWQEGYGIISFREKEIAIIRNYIKNQKEHHASQKLYPDLEIIK